MDSERRIQFDFDERKATEAAAYILERAGGRLDIYPLIKLLYLAERESLRRYHAPIFGDVYVSLPKGPIVQIVYDLTKDDATFLEFEPQYWPYHIERSGYRVTLKQPIERKTLSRADIDVLDFIMERYGHEPGPRLMQITEALPEWQNPGASRIPILTEDLLARLGASQAQRERIRIDTESFRHMVSTLNQE